MEGLNCFTDECYALSNEIVEVMKKYNLSNPENATALCLAVAAFLKTSTVYGAKGATVESFSFLVSEFMKDM